jgi:hypothetical protein
VSDWTTLVPVYRRLCPSNETPNEIGRTEEIRIINCAAGNSVHLVAVINTLEEAGIG